MKSMPGPSRPPASSKPGTSGGMKCVGMSPITSPPRVRRIASRSKPATTARRTSTLSNGLIVVFIATQRPPPFGTSVELLLRLREHLLEDLGLRREVAVDHALALEDLARRHRGVVVALRHVDLVEVRGLEVEALVPVRVADEVDPASGLVADRLARRVVLDHVRARRDLVLAVRRTEFSLSNLRRVLLRHRGRERQGERAGDDAAGALGEVEDDRLVVRRLDAGDLRARLGADLRALEVTEVRAGVAVVDRVEEAALDRVLDVLRGDLAVDGRRELDARLDLDRDGLAVLGDLRIGLGEVRNRVDGVLGLVAVERPSASPR